MENRTDVKAKMIEDAEAFGELLANVADAWKEVSEEEEETELDVLYSVISRFNLGEVLLECVELHQAESEAFVSEGGDPFFSDNLYHNVRIALNNIHVASKE